MAIYYINPATGNDSNTSVQAQDPSTPWRTVKTTIAKLTSGDIVHLAGGQYRENAITAVKTNITWICDGPVQWMGTRAQPGGGWGWVNHSENCYKILAFVATYGFTPISVVEEDFNHWLPVLCKDTAQANSSTSYFERPMRATGLLNSDIGDRITHCIRYEGTMYYETATDTLFYHSWQSEDPATVTVGIGALNDGAWTIGSGNILNPVGSEGYINFLWCLRNAPTTGQLNDGGSLVLSAGGTGYLIRQAGFLQTRCVTHASNTSVAAVEDCWVDQVTQRGEVVELPVTSITRSGSTATVTLGASGAGMITGLVHHVFGADQPEYNGAHVITRISSTIFTFEVTGTPATPATGTMVATRFDSLGLGSGPSPSPNSLSSGAAGSGSTYNNIQVTRGFNAISNAAAGVTFKNVVTWCHPNHNITGSLPATFQNVYAGSSQDGLFTSDTNVAPGIVMTDSIVEEKINTFNVDVRHYYRRNVVGYAIVRGSAPTWDSTDNLFLGMDEKTSSDAPGVGGIVYTHSEVNEYKTVGPGSGLCTTFDLECTSFRGNAESWHDGSLFQGHRDTRLFPYREELLPAPGSLLVGKKIGFWNRFRAPQLKRQWPDRGYPSVGRPLAGW